MVGALPDPMNNEMKCVCPVAKVLHVSWTRSREEVLKVYTIKVVKANLILLWGKKSFPEQN